MRTDGARRTALLVLCLVVAAVAFFLPAPAETPERLAVARSTVSNPGGRPATVVVANNTVGTTQAVPTSVAPVNTATMDRDAPTSVGDLALASNTLESLTVTWAAASDNVAVDHYVIVIDGVEVATVSTTAVVIPWDGRAMILEVIAVDAAGNRSEAASLEIVSPYAGGVPPAETPTPIPSASGPGLPTAPSATPTPSPTPTPSASPSASPSALPNPSASGSATATATPAPPSPSASASASRSSRPTATPSV